MKMKTVGDVINMYPKQYKVTLAYPIEVVVNASDQYEAEEEARPYAMDILEDMIKAHDQSDGEFELMDVQLIVEDE